MNAPDAFLYAGRINALNVCNRARANAYYHAKKAAGR